MAACGSGRWNYGWALLGVLVVVEAAAAAAQGVGGSASGKYVKQVPVSVYEGARDQELARQQQEYLQQQQYQQPQYQQQSVSSPSYYNDPNWMYNQQQAQQQQQHQQQQAPPQQPAQPLAPLTVQQWMQEMLQVQQMQHMQHMQQMQQDQGTVLAERLQVPAPAPAPGPTDLWTKTVDEVISRGVTQLALNLAESVERDSDSNGPPANVVFSPVNVASALALVLAGSNGTTFQEIAKVLGIAAGVDLLGKREQVHKEFGRYLTMLETQSTMVNAANPQGNMAAVQGDGNGNQVVFANGLFVQEEYNVQPYFADIADSYRAEVTKVDFTRHAATTKDTINRWFANHTMNRISSVLAEAPPADTRLMIASALYFNGAWETPFPSEATMTRPFYSYNMDGSRVAFPVRMMTNNMDLPYAANRSLGCRLLELPYRSREQSMFLILPDAQDLRGLRELERRLTPQVLRELLESRKDAPVIYSVPKMKLERSISLRSALETLGVRSLFDSQLADLTHLSDSVSQRIDEDVPPPPPSPPGYPQPHPRPQQPRPQQPQAPQRPAPAPAAASAAAPTTTPSPPAPTPAATNPPQRHTHRTVPVKTTMRPHSAVENNISDQLIFADRMSQNFHANSVKQPSAVERVATPSVRLYADDVLHKVEVEVTETGTVAAAVTAITISRDGSNHVMRFNRPFLFFIRHNPTDLVLFWGSVVRPQPEWIVQGIDVNTLTPQHVGAGAGHRVPPPGAPQQSAAPGPARRGPQRQQQRQQQPQQVSPPAG